MNVYFVKYSSGYSSALYDVRVLAKNASEAIDFAARDAKKNYRFSSFEVLNVEKLLKVDVYYKTK